MQRCRRRSKRIKIEPPSSPAFCSHENPIIVDEPTSVAMDQESAMASQPAGQDTAALSHPVASLTQSPEFAYQQRRQRYFEHLGVLYPTWNAGDVNQEILPLSDHRFGHLTEIWMITTNVNHVMKIGETALSKDVSIEDTKFFKALVLQAQMWRAAHDSCKATGKAGVDVALLPKHEEVLALKVLCNLAYPKALLDALSGTEAEYLLLPLPDTSPTETANTDLKAKVANLEEKAAKLETHALLLQCKIEQLSQDSMREGPDVASLQKSIAELAATPNWNCMDAGDVAEALEEIKGTRQYTWHKWST